jgi:hypothetical protein
MTAERNGGVKEGKEERENPFSGPSLLSPDSLSIADFFVHVHLSSCQQAKFLKKKKTFID